MKPITRYYLTNKRGEFLHYIQGQIFTHYPTYFEIIVDSTSFYAASQAKQFRDINLKNPDDWSITKLVIQKA